MRILLTNNPFQYFHTTAFYHPDWGALNLAQLAAMVDTPQNQIRLLDNWHSWFRQDSILRDIKDFKPDLVGISNNADGDTEITLERAKQIKQKFPGIILVGGGEAATFKCDYLLNGGFDIVVLGEGEITFRELVQALNKKEDDFSHIKGLAYKEGGQIVKTEARPLIKALDELPFPARQYQRRFRSIFFPGRYSAEIETARGCPYTCEYCSINTFWGRVLRKKSNGRIMEEFRQIKHKFGATQVYFIDDSFGLDTSGYADLLRLMIKEELNIKWFTQIRPDTVANNPEMIEAASRTGLFGVLIGFEGYDENILKGVGKNLSPEVNTRASEILRKNKIAIFGVHMFNLPGQTSRDYYLTYKYGSRNSDIFRLSMFSPIPGTQIFDRLKKQGKIRMHEVRNYPYAYYMVDGKANFRKMKLQYYWYLILHYFSPATILGSFFNPNRLLRVMKSQAYVQNFRYVTYLLLRKVGVKIL